MCHRLSSSQPKRTRTAPVPGERSDMALNLLQDDVSTCLIFIIEYCAVHKYLGYVQRLRRLSSGRFLPRLGPLGNQRSFFCSACRQIKSRRRKASAFLLLDLGNAWLDPMSVMDSGYITLYFDNYLRIYVKSKNQI